MGGVSELAFYPSGFVGVSFLNSDLSSAIKNPASSLFIN